MLSAPINYPEFNYVEKAPGYPLSRSCSVITRSHPRGFCAIPRAISRIAVQSALYVTLRYERFEFQAQSSRIYGYSSLTRRWHIYARQGIPYHLRLGLGF